MSRTSEKPGHVQQITPELRSFARKAHEGHVRFLAAVVPFFVLFSITTFGTAALLAALVFLDFIVTSTGVMVCMVIAGAGGAVAAIRIHRRILRNMWNG